MLLASEFRAVPGVRALIHTRARERPRDFWSWGLSSGLAATAVLVVLAVSICTAVGSEAEGLEVPSGDRIGVHSPGKVATWSGELVPPG